jgi:catechol 2,3-dioxygenase-like lactoylglutathione lyase family enzyme
VPETFHRQAWLRCSQYRSISFQTLSTSAAGLNYTRPLWKRQFAGTELGLLDNDNGATNMTLTANLDLFAGIPVADYAAALAWYERLLGAPPAFLPNDIEAVWELADHRFLYIVQQPEHAGHARHTVFVADLEALVAQIAERGLEPALRETYANGVRKITYRDPDGNELSLGGAPL